MKPDTRSAEDQAARPRGGGSGKFCKHHPAVERVWMLRKTSKHGAMALCAECNRRNCAKYHQENSDAVSERKAKRKRDNPEFILAQQTRWKNENREKYRECSRRFSKRHPEKIRAKSAKRRATLREAIIPDEPFDQYGQHSGKDCFICGASAEATDHIKPLSQKGAHANFNFAPICKPCNSAKRDHVWPGQPGWNEFVMERQQRKAS